MGTQISTLVFEANMPSDKQFAWQLEKGPLIQYLSFASFQFKRVESSGELQSCLAEVEILNLEKFTKTGP